MNEEDAELLPSLAETQDADDARSFVREFAAHVVGWMLALWALGAVALPLVRLCGWIDLSWRWSFAPMVALFVLSLVLVIIGCACAPLIDEGNLD